MIYRKKTKEQIILCKYLYIIVVSVFAILAAAVPSQGRVITDMYGHRFTMPDRPKRVYSASPPVTYMLYALDPSMLAGLNFPLRDWEKKYLDKRMQSLPVLGGWFGQAQRPNFEMVLKVQPEIIVVMKAGGAINSNINEAVMKTMPIPVIQVGLDDLSDYPDAFISLGKILGRETRARELASYIRKTLSEAKTLASVIPLQKKISVYYAEGVEGLSTECDSSWHAELIPLAGGRNVHHCRTKDLMGMEKLSFEQLMLYNPEVMIVMEKVFYEKVFSDPLWQRLKAVRNKRVYLIPKQPFNWFDRPPSFMRFLGAKWLANLLHPDKYRIDMVKETQKFFKLFLAVNLNAQETRSVLCPRSR